MYKKFMLFFVFSLSFILSGCVTYGGNPSHYTSVGEDKVNYNYLIFKGWGMGTSGTSTPITTHYSLTTFRVANVTDQIQQYPSDVCGLTLIKKDNSKKTLPVLASVKDGEPVTSYGFDYYTGKLKTSSGKTVKLIEARGYMNSSENCIVYEATTGNDDAMSGGPVFNSKNELVGILVYSAQYEYYSEIDQSEPFEDYQFGKLVIRHMNREYTPFMPEYDVTRKQTKVNYSVFVPFSSIKGWLNSAMRSTTDFDEYNKRDLKNNKIMQF